MALFDRPYGIVVACDVGEIRLLEHLVTSTCDVSGIVGYKIGAILALKYGLKVIADKISRLTDLPLIYDHQKFGTDIPNFCGGEVLVTIKKAGVDALIIFPQSGPETLKACLMGHERQNMKPQVPGCFKLGLVPIVGAVMTHPKYLESEGGYIADESLQMIFRDAALYGVEHYVLPSTKLEFLKELCDLIKAVVEKPKFLFPGIGKHQQGGDIVSAFDCANGCSSYAIIGRKIYQATDISETARDLSRIIEEYEHTPEAARG